METVGSRGDLVATYVFRYEHWVTDPMGRREVRDFPFFSAIFFVILS